MDNDHVLITYVNSKTYFVAQDCPKTGRYSKFKKDSKLRLQVTVNNKSKWVNAILSYRGKTLLKIHLKF